MSINRTMILIVDDEPKYVRALTAILEASGYETTAAVDGPSAIEAAARYTPALILLDVRLPRIDGHEVCRRIRQFSLVPVIMLTALAQKEDVVKGLEAGADDYLTKPFSTEELLARVQAALRRANYNEIASIEPVFRSGEIMVDYARCQVTRAGQEIRLTPTEYRLLCELTRAAGRVVSTEVILENVWGQGYAGEEQLVTRVVHRMRQKIEPVPSQPVYLLTHIGMGYIFQK